MALRLITVTSSPIFLIRDNQVLANFKTKLQISFNFKNNLTAKQPKNVL